MRIYPGGVAYMDLSHPHAFAVDPTAHNKVYVASRDGLLASTNFGATWRNYWTSTSFEEVPQGRMIFDASSGIVYLPTFSKGLLALNTWCADADNDGWSPEGGSCGPQDCNDNNAAIYPNRNENCFDGLDNNCNNLIDYAELFCSTTCVDQDSDGQFPTVCGGTDCNNNDGSVYLGAPEVCDRKDNDCDKRIDEDFDKDGDRWTTCGGDCNDNDYYINPYAYDIPIDGIDQNCDGYDMFLVTKASYSPSKGGMLTVRVLSTIGGDADISCTYGNLVWDEKHGYWEGIFEGIGEMPYSITVEGLEGYTYTDVGQ